ncbi:MAG TPA: PilZ domain-containing protein [Gemmatimonadaceae bacterium]|jgi:hypothetical protein
MTDSRRSHYRVVYPIEERPTFNVGRFFHEVVDLSEKGLRYEVKDRRVPTVGSKVAGTLAFKRGGDLAITGEVIRSRGGLVVIVLDKPLEFAEVLAEQKYLRTKGYTLLD